MPPSTAATLRRLESIEQRFSVAALRLWDQHALARGTIVARILAARSSEARARAAKALDDANAKLTIKIAEGQRAMGRALRALPADVRAGRRPDPFLGLRNAAGGAESLVTMRTPAGVLESIPARFAAAELGELITSVEPSSLEARVDYPRACHESLATSSIEELARRLPSLALTTATGPAGTPIVTAGAGIVLGGNALVIALLRAYDQTLATALARDASMFGLQPGDVQQHRRPIIVRVVALPSSRWPRLKQQVATLQAQNQRLPPLQLGPNGFQVGG